MIKNFTVNVNNLTKPIGDEGLGTILVIDNEHDIPYKLIEEPGELITELGTVETESKIYKIAEKIFNADKTPESIAVFGDSSTVDSSELKASLDKLIDEQKSEWFFLTSTMNDDETITMLSKWVLDNDKVYFATTQDLEIVELTESDNTALGYHNDVDDYFTEGLARSMAMKEIGSATAMYQQIKGSTPSDIGLTDLKKLHKDNGFTYVRQMGENYVSEGKMTGGAYIDITLTSYFIKFKLEEALFKLAINRDKIGYNDEDIGLMVAEVETVLQTATRQGAVLKEGGKGVYEITAIRRKDMPRESIARRKYNGISAKVVVDGAVHSAEINIDLVLGEDE